MLIGDFAVGCDLFNVSILIICVRNHSRCFGFFAHISDAWTDASKLYIKWIGFTFRSRARKLFLSVVRDVERDIDMWLYQGIKGKKECLCSM